MEELKKVNCDEWKNKEPGSEYSTPFAIQSSNQIDEALQNCDDILSEIGCGIGYDSKQSKMKTLLTDAACLVNYVYSIVADIKFEIDEPLRESFSKKATETISRIKAEDIETSYNPDGIQGTVNIGGIIESTRPMPLKKLKFEDFMSEDRIGGPARDKFAKLFKAQYDEAIKLGGINKSTSYDEYIEKLTKDGEFDHVVDSPYESFLSSLLDVTIIKPLIEAYTGYDMITGEDLTYSGRFLKVGVALIDIVTIGQATAGLEGLRAVSATMKAVGVNAITNGVAMGANEIAEDLNLPAGLRLILSLGAGYAVSKVAGKYILTNSEGKVIGEYEGGSKARNVEEGSASDSYLYQKYKESLVKDDVLNNSEEIITGDKFGDEKLIAELTKDGSNIEDWSKMESNYSYTNEYGTGKIHYYMNVRTGKVSYYDAKMKISAPKSIRSGLKNTVTDKDGFWIVDLDENLIPIGVRK